LQGVAVAPCYAIFNKISPFIGCWLCRLKSAMLFTLAFGFYRHIFRVQVGISAHDAQKVGPCPYDACWLWFQFDVDRRGAARMLFVVGIYIWFGAIVGSCSLWAIVHLGMGISVPLMRLLRMTCFVFDFVLF
jgi:hypothetical protein